MRQFWIWLVILIVLAAGWVGASWYLGERSTAELERFVESHREKNDFSLFDIEIEQVTSNPFIANFTAKLTVPGLTGSEPVNLAVTRYNGPVVYREGYGLQLAAARWHILPAKEPDESNVGIEPVVSNPFQSHDFSAGVQKSFLDDWVVDGRWKAPKIFSGYSVGGAQFNASYTDIDEQLIGDIAVSDLRISSEKGMALNADAAALDFQYPSLTAVSGQSGSLRVALNMPEAKLKLAAGQPLQKLALSGNGLIWPDNDTLSADLELVGNINADKLQRWLLSIKANDLRRAAMIEYVRSRSALADLTQQSEWALEEVETPEQQDFLHGLFSDMNRLKQQQSSELFQGFLLPEKSKINAHLSIQQDNEAVAVLDVESAAGKATRSAQIPVRGELTALRLQSNTAWHSLLKRWHRRRWLRAYDDSYEADFNVSPNGLLVGNTKLRVQAVIDELLGSLLDQ